MVAILAVVLMGIAAFAVDLGIAYAAKRQLSVAADAASLAGAQAAGRAYPVGTTCTKDVADSLYELAEAAAFDVYQAQAPKQSDGDPTVIVECHDDYDALNVSVYDSATYPTIFGWAIGTYSLNPGASATAQVSGSPFYGDVIPYAVCDSLVDGLPDPDPGESGETPFESTEPEAPATRQSEFSFVQKATSIDCESTPAGNWGLVALGGRTTGNAPNIASWTENGYPGSFTFPTIMYGATGSGFNSENVRDALSSLLGDIVLFPIADEWVVEEEPCPEDLPCPTPLPGANGWFTTPGLLPARFCGWYISNGQNDYTLPENGGCWDEDLLAQRDADTDLVIQWQQVDDYVTSYRGAGGAASRCSLGDEFCLPAVRLFR